MAPVDPRDNPRGVEAARRVMLELWSILGEYRDSLTLVGGSTPPLLVGDVPGDPYTGTLDVDLIVDPLGVPEETYRTIAETLRERGYWQEPRPKQPFQWFREIEVDGEPVTVEIDLLAPATARSGGRSHRHEQIEGEPLARRTVGAELVREAYVEREFAGTLPDGRPNRIRLRVASVAVVVVLKALAMAERDKPKDAYDLDYLLAHTTGGPDAVADELAGLPSGDPVTRALAVLSEKFASCNATSRSRCRRGIWTRDVRCSGQYLEAVDLVASRIHGDESRGVDSTREEGDEEAGINLGRRKVHQHSAGSAAAGRLDPYAGDVGRDDPERLVDDG